MEEVVLDVWADYHGQQAGLQSFSICNSITCLLTPNRLSRLMVTIRTPPELPEQPVSVPHAILGQCLRFAGMAIPKNPQ